MTLKEMKGRTTADREEIAQLTELYDTERRQTKIMEEALR